MKICFFISTLSSGGAERNVSLLANHFVKKNKVTIFTLEDKKSKSFYKISKKVKLVKLDLLSKSKNIFSSLINFFNRVLIIRKKLLDENTEVYISFLETMNLTVLIASFGLENIKLKVISDRNNPKKSEKFFLIFVLKFLFYRTCDFLVLQTKSIIANYKFIKKNKIKIISNSIVENLIIKKQFKKKEKIKILCAGRLELQKDYYTLLKSLCILNKKNIKFSCDIYGTGSEKQKIINLINQFNLKNNVFLKGVTNKLYKLYHKYDLYILSSKYEGYPNTLLEAVSTQVPSISSDCEYGPNEIIKNKVNGLLFQVGNPNDLSKKIIFLKNSNYKFINKLKDYNKKNFNPKKINFKILSLWEKLIKKK
tara:strand:+ start:966 stop:2063 length:1098 start_codon:yes stop_codon:yes gene_type:complete